MLEAVGVVAYIYVVVSQLAYSGGHFLSQRIVLRACPQPPQLQAEQVEAEYTAVGTHSQLV